MFDLIWENFRISLSSIFANKSRSILSVLGIVIGVLSVTLMGTMISGLDATFEKSMASFRSNVLFISRMDWFGGDWDWWELRNRPRIKQEYGEKLRIRSQFVEAVAPTSDRGGRIIEKINKLIHGFLERRQNTWPLMMLLRLPVAGFLLKVKTDQEHVWL